MTVNPTLPAIDERYPAATPTELAVHRDFLDSVRQLKTAMVRACYYLDLVRERKIYRALGYQGISEYAHAEAGLSRYQCETFLELARRLPDLPAIRALVERGELSWSRARLLCQVVTPETEHEWLEAARRLTARQLADAIRRSASGTGGRRRPSRT